MSKTGTGTMHGLARGFLVNQNSFQYYPKALRTRVDQGNVPGVTDPADPTLH